MDRTVWYARQENHGWCSGPDSGFTGLQLDAHYDVVGPRLIFNRVPSAVGEKIAEIGSRGQGCLETGQPAESLKPESGTKICGNYQWARIAGTVLQTDQTAG